MLLDGGAGEAEAFAELLLRRQLFKRFIRSKRQWLECLEGLYW
jgi:hypothetical protein